MGGKKECRHYFMVGTDDKADQFSNVWDHERGGPCQLHPSSPQAITKLVLNQNDLKGKRDRKHSQMKGNSSVYSCFHGPAQVYERKF